MNAANITAAKTLKSNELALEAQERIAEGESPDRWVHIVEMGKDAYLSTSIPEVEPGLTAKYYQLADVAGW